MFCISSLCSREVDVAIWLSWCYYDGSRLLYIPSPPGFVYLSGIHKACPVNACRVPMIARTGNLVMKLAFFFVACCDGYLSHTLWYSQYD